MNTNLRPCPLCGSEVRIADLGGWEVLCNCGLNFELPGDGENWDRDKTIAAWNRRWELPKSMVHRLATQMGWTPPAGKADVEDMEPGYRALTAEDRIQLGDEYRDDDGEWKPVSGIAVGMLYKSASFRPCRRRTAGVSGGPDQVSCAQTPMKAPKC